MALGTSALAILSLLGTAVTDAPMVINFIQTSVSAVEATGQTGDQKLAAVLNATEAFLGELAPSFSGDLAAFMAAVEAFVNDLVALYNTAGVFVKAVEKAI